MKAIYGIDSEDRFGRSNAAVKYQEPNHCDDCGTEFNPPLSKKMLKEQLKQKDNFYYRISCDSCISKGHTITDEELRGVKKVISN